MIASIVIAVFNRENLIEQCISSVLDQTLKDGYEVIVVDDASTDNTRQILAKFADPKLTVLCNEKNRGPSYSRNRAIQQSHGQYVVFLDSDCIVDHGWIEEIIKPFDKDIAIAIVSGKTIDPAAKTYWEMVNEGVNFIAQNDGYVKEAHTCNMAFRGDFIRKSLFDETLPFSEDLDLCLKCLRSNCKIYYTSKATLLHFHRSTFKSTVYSYFCWGKYNAFVRLRWMELPFVSYGTYVLLGSVGALLLGFSKIAGIIFIVYLVLLFCVGIRHGGKNFTKLIASYPAGIMISLANFVGNLLGLVLFIRRKLFQAGTS